MKKGEGNIKYGTDMVWLLNNAWNEYRTILNMDEKCLGKVTKYGVEGLGNQKINMDYMGLGYSKLNRLERVREN